MLSAIPDIDRPGLRSFGLLTGLIVAALFGLALPWLLEHEEIPRWPWAVAATLAGLAAAAPTWLRPVYRGWMTFGLVMSRITTPVLLGVLFLFVVTPIARLRALGRNDPLTRHFDRDASSYRITSKAAAAKDLERPF